METSSPLATMQSSAAMFGHCGYKAFGPNSFNFKDLSMKKSQSDYFNVVPMRGSSPTASLAADFGQNLGFGLSPHIQTPSRRLFAAGFHGGLGGHGNIETGAPYYGLPHANRDHAGDFTTPPPPSSSPGPSSDSMDIIPSSPLPHKPAYGSTFEVRLQSPTPELTPADSSSLSIPSPSLDTPLEPTKLSLPQERRKPGPARPALSRAKGCSTGYISTKPSGESRLPPFKFGNGVSKLTTSSSMTLSEIFAESPAKDRPLAPPNPMMGPPRSRQPLAGLASNIRNGSPVSGHVRKTSNPMFRPRKQFRRSLSMFEHPEDVMKQDQPTCTGATLPSITDIEPEHVPQLPYFIPDDRPGDLPRINKKTLIEVLDGNFNQLYEKLLVIDCRFEYEYNGGHINGAVNFNDKEELSSQLFDIEPTQKALLIFHCEYSAHRAPIMAKFIRNKDRAINAERYPSLTYPELYILDGGYSSFFKDHRPRCFPQNYVEMEAKEHAQACERGLGKVKQRSKLVRAQTFAFGQHSPCMDSSPTAPCRPGPEVNMDMDMDISFDKFGLDFPTNDITRLHNRRMFSY